MKSSSIKIILACLVAVPVVFSGAAMAQSKTDAYLVDGRGLVAKNSTGLCWQTGYWTPAQAIAECDPTLVKAPPKAEPPKVAPPAKLPPGKVTFTADALFDTNKAVLKPEGIAKLDAFAAKLKDVKYEVIITVGHADFRGSDAFNKKLSIRRAEAVKAYLVKEKKIEPNRIYADGKGESEPVTKKDQCKGLSGQKLSDCLQPDRRVEVEVAGTRESK